MTKQKSSQQLSVVSLAYNNPTELLLTLTSISLQETHPDRVLVVDGSTADERQSIKSIAERFSAKYLWVTPRGVYDAMNKSLNELPEDSFVLFLNSGDWFCSPRSVSHLKIALDDNHGSDWLVGDTIRISADGWNVGLRHRVPHPTRSGLRFRDFWFPHPSTAVRVSRLLEQGGFDQRFKIAADYHMSLKLFQALGPPALLDKPVACHNLDGLSSQQPLASTLQRSAARLGVFGWTQAVFEAIILVLRGAQTLLRALHRGKQSQPREDGKVTPPPPPVEHYCPESPSIAWPQCCSSHLGGA